MGELAVSRAIGDHCLRPYVIPEPEVRHMFMSSF
jgi:protein phosphatase 2C